jgi:prepilin-type N-terminal cleavage/methylation domain-containing protein
MKVNRNHKQAGFTLMELIAGLAVVAVVVTGALALYSSASSSELNTTLARDLNALQSATRQIFQGQGSYGSATTNLNDILVAAKKVPTSIKIDTSSTPDTLTHRANGSVNIASTGSSFSISLSNIDADLCIPMLSGATGWTSVQAGTATARTALPVSPANAQTDCATGTTLVFTN